MEIKLYKPAFAPMSEAQRRALEALNPQLVCDVLGGDQTMDAGIRPLAPGMAFLGQARTVQTRGDNAAAIVATPLMRPGEVMVIDHDSNDYYGCWGDITTLEAMKFKVAGLVVDGCVRDSVDTIRLGFPLFARNLQPRGAGAARGGAIDAPVVAGGVLVHPGDVVFADNDGVVVIPRARLDDIIAAAQAKQEKERAWVAAIEGGVTLAKTLGIPDPVPAD